MNTRIAEMESRIRNDLQSLAIACEASADYSIAAHLSRSGGLTFSVSRWVDGEYANQGGDSLQEAIADIEKKYPRGIELAKQKREQAKQLLREANEIESESQNPEPKND